MLSWNTKNLVRHKIFKESCIFSLKFKNLMSDKVDGHIKESLQLNKIKMNLNFTYNSAKSLINANGFFLF